MASVVLAAEKARGGRAILGAHEIIIRADRYTWEAADSEYLH